MSISITYTCGGCHESAAVWVYRITTPIFKSMERFESEGGYCRHHWPGVADALPPGWGICIVGAVYCPRCFAEVNGDTETTEPTKLALALALP